MGSDKLEKHLLYYKTSYIENLYRGTSKFEHKTSGQGTMNRSFLFSALIMRGRTVGRIQGAFKVLY